MYVEELIAWAEEKAKSPYVRSPPIKSRPLRNVGKDRVLFSSTYNEYDTGFECGPMLDGNEVGQEDLVAKSNYLENLRTM